MHSWVKCLSASKAKAHASLDFILAQYEWAEPCPIQLPANSAALHAADESGIGSGVRRDWLNSMMKSMLDPRTGLFESCDGGRTWQPCPLAHLQEEHLVYFEMLGELCLQIWRFMS